MQGGLNLWSSLSGKASRDDDRMGGMGVRVVVNRTAITLMETVVAMEAVVVLLRWR